MIIVDNHGVLELGSKTEERHYDIRIGQNGKRYVDRKSVGNNVCHVIEGNSKTGPVLGWNLPIEYSCVRGCDCYLKGVCYAGRGCYNFANNQADYTENFNFYRSHTDEELQAAFQFAIDAVRNATKWRYFTIGDIPDKRFIGCMVTNAKQNPQITHFWTYTKKYDTTNEYLKEHGAVPFDEWVAEHGFDPENPRAHLNGALPDNLTIIFSHWRNDDGTYFPMPNPYNLPTSEFIPLGQEYLTEQVTHICPCSDPTVHVTCATCDHPCGELMPGQSMALLEHSTTRTRKRDKEIKEQRERNVA